MDILIVEDVPLVRQKLVRLVRGVGGVSQVREAGSLAEASEAILQAEPGLMILDLDLPDGRGLDLLRALRVKGLRWPVLVCTALNLNIYRSACLAAGAIEVYDKVLGIEDLLAAVGRLAGNMTASGRRGSH